MINTSTSLISDVIGKDAESSRSFIFSDSINKTHNKIIHLDNDIGNLRCVITSGMH